MKKTTCWFATLGVVLGMGQSLLGLPAYESFNYAGNAALIGQSPGGGLTWSPAGSGAEQPTIESGNLPVPGLASPTGNRVRMVAGAGTSARLPFGGAVSNGAVFCSFAMKVANVAGLGTGTDFIAAFTPSDVAQATTPTNGFARIFLRAASGGYQIGLAKSSSVAGDIAWHPTAFGTNDTVFVVGSCTFTAGPGNDTARLWINPSTATFGSSDAPAPTLTITTGSDTSQAASFVLFQKPAPILPALLQLDELRLGASWASVTPPAVADLAVSVGSLPAQLEEGSLLTVPITVSNLGPHTATSVQLTFAVPAGAVLQSVSNDHGGYTVQGSNVTCSVSALAAQQSFNVQAIFGVDPQFAGQTGEEFWDWDWDFFASALESDSNPANDQAHAAVMVFPKLDFGDARLGYPVTRAENGARHRNGAVWHLGILFDREPNGVHSALADADDLAGAPDDEDGVALPTTFLAGHTHTVMVKVPVAGFLDAFFDFNNDGDWLDVFERVTPFGGLAIGPGVVPVSVTVPLAAVTGSPHARFRFSDVGGLAPTGFHFLGEVEDYQVEIRRVDFGSAPDPLYPTLLASDGARHVVDPAWYLGAPPDWEADGLDGADGDGVVFTTPLTPGALASVQVTASIAGLLDAFIDFNGDGDWTDANERITPALGTPVVAGVNVLNFTVPAGATTGATWARFRFSNTGGLASTGPANIGEVEDYPITIAPPAPSPDLVVRFGNLQSDTFATQPFSYSVTVSNAGDATATGVSLVVRNEGPLTSAPTVTLSQGSYQVVSNEVQCALGQLGAGQSANVQITVTPGNQETLRLVAQVAEAEADSRLIDNLAERFVLVHPLITASCACSCYTNSTWPTPDPLLKSWYTAGSGQYARVLTNSGGTPQTLWLAVQDSPGGGDSRTNVGPVYADIQKIQDSGDAVYVTAHGLASHVMGPWYCDAALGNLFPNTPTNLYTTSRIPRNPTPNDGHPVTPMGAMGVWVNGTAIYNMLDGFIYDPAGSNDASGPGVTGYWHRNAYVSELITFDPAVFHQPADGQYHSHASPLYLRAQQGDNLLILHFTNGEIAQIRELGTPVKHSPILGWAFDGHPIYGPYGYSDPMDTNSGIQRMVSGYVVRDGQYGTTDMRETGRTTLPAWTLCMQDRTNQILDAAYWGPPPTNGVDTSGHCNAISWDLGRYAEDYAFLGDLFSASHLGAEWDLDRYNGRCCKTPEFPDGTYAYFVTLDTNGVPAFPYIIGWEYCSTNTGGVVTSATELQELENVPAYYSALNAYLNTMGFSNGLFGLQWLGREGGTYHVSASANLQQWTQISPSMTTTGRVFNYTAPLGPNPPAQQFFRVELERDGGTARP